MATVVESGDWHFVPNLVPTSNGEVFEALSSCFEAAGWTLIARSDGTTYDDSAPARLSVSEWQNAHAYEHWRTPGVSGRDVVVQANGTAVQVRVWHGPAGVAFTGGNATTAPTHADAVQLVGNAGAYDSNFANSTPSSSRYQFGACDTGKGTTDDVFAWYLLRRSVGVGANERACVVDALDTIADGVVGDADAEPWAHVSSLSAVASVSAWYKYGLSGEQWVNGGLLWDHLRNVDTINPYSGAYDLHTLTAYDNTGGLLQTKGRSVHLRLKGVTGHTTGDTYNSATATPALAVFDDLAIPYPDNTAPTI